MGCVRLVIVVALIALPQIIWAAERYPAGNRKSRGAEQRVRTAQHSAPVADRNSEDALETALRHAETGLALVDRNALVTAHIELDDAMALIGQIRPDRSERYARLIEQLSLLYYLLDEATSQDEPTPDLDGPVPDDDLADLSNGLALPRLQIPVNQAIRTYMAHLIRHRRDVIQQAFHRAGRYLQFAKATFKAHGVPEELVNLAYIESAWNPHAVSPAQAVGIWQFIASTARRYGLAVTSRMDERRHPIKSTRAAARYLKDLHRQFKSWPLAIAAYNCGEDCVRRAIDRQRTRDVWALRLPDETRRYVPAVLAMTIIASDPERYGFTPPRS